MSKPDDSLGRGVEPERRDLPQFDPAQFDLAQWRAAATAECGGRALVARATSAGQDLEPIYTAADRDALPFTDTAPGSYPFVRGARASMYHGRPWTIRQYAGFSTAEDSNAFYRNALAQGQRGLSVAFDLATHRGYDSDHPRVRGDVGKAGVAIDSADDMLRLFDGIDLGSVSVSMTMNGAVLPVMAAYLVASEEQGSAAPRAQLRGTLQNDILKEFLVRNTYIYPPAPSMRIVSDIVAFCSAELPKFNPISISGYHFQEAGATSELELALTLADGLEYVRAAAQAGLAVDDFAPRLSFFFGVGMNLFVEVAKLRAARLLWAELMKERFAPSRPESLRLRMHCQTSGVSLTSQQPLNNITRTTVEALAAILGGTQSLHTNSFDEAIALPSDAAARVARNTQLILQHETDLTHAVDPLGGSYLVETLTHDLARKARAIIDEIESHGGMVEAIDRGLPQGRLAHAAAARQLRLDTEEDRLIGVNCFVEQGEIEPEVRVIDNEQVLREQVQRLQQLRHERDDAQVESMLAALEAGAKSEQNLLELSVDCMRARATVGEVSERLERVFGRYSPQMTHVAGVFSSGYADDSEWQDLRQAIEQFERKAGRRPRILVAKLGQDGHDRGARVIAAGFADLGFDVDLGALFQTPAEVAQAALDSDVHVVGVSTQAASHLTLVPQLLSQLRDVGADDVLVVCGGVIPKQDHPALRDAGVAAVFEPGSRVRDCAARVLELLQRPA